MVYIRYIGEARTCRQAGKRAAYKTFSHTSPPTQQPRTGGHHHYDSLKRLFPMVYVSTAYGQDWEIRTSPPQLGLEEV